MILTGTASNSAEAQQAYDIAARLLGAQTSATRRKAPNRQCHQVRGRDQVMIKVTVAEVQRDVIKQLGIDLNGSLGYGTAVVNFNTPIHFRDRSGPERHLGIARAIQWADRTDIGISATLRAMERAGVIRTLAEPNLTAISGESANFLAGGEFPVLTGSSCTDRRPICQQQVTFKKFGVSLTFTPVVLSEGPNQPEGDDGSVRPVDRQRDDHQRAGYDQTVTIPSVKTRRADTTVEIPSGGSLAMAGMIQEQTKQQINGLPGLMQVPVLGSLFRSRDYHQSPDRADGAGHALHGARRRAKGSVAAGRRLRRCVRSGEPSCSAASTASMASPANAQACRPLARPYGFILD